MGTESIHKASPGAWVRKILQYETILALLPPPKHRSQMFWGMRSCLDVSNSGYKIQSCSRADPTVLADKCYGSALAIAMDNESMEFTNILQEFLADPIRDELKLGRLTKIAWPEPSKSPSQEFRDLLASLPTDLVKLLWAKNGKFISKNLFQVKNASVTHSGTLLQKVVQEMNPELIRVLLQHGRVILHSTQIT